MSPTGLSPDLQSMEQIRRIMRPTDVPDTGRSAHSHTAGHFLFFSLLSEELITL